MNSKKCESVDINRHLNFEEASAHLHKGYDNSQSVVRFLDAKASAVIAAIPVLIGVLASVFKWFEGWSGWRSSIEAVGIIGPVLVWTIITFTGFLIVIRSGLSISYAFAALCPRKPQESSPSLLFPYALPGNKLSSEQASNAKLFTKRLQSFMCNPTIDFVYEDYQIQLQRMSEIVAEKVFYVELAVKNLRLILDISWVFLFWILIQFLNNKLTSSIFSWPYEYGEKKLGTDQELLLNAANWISPLGILLMLLVLLIAYAIARNFILKTVRPI